MRVLRVLLFSKAVKVSNYNLIGLQKYFDLLLSSNFYENEQEPTSDYSPSTIQSSNVRLKVGLT